MLGVKIKEHEENIKFLKTQNNKLDDSILDFQGIVVFLFAIDSQLMSKSILNN
jgi:hypothetical protein